VNIEDENKPFPVGYFFVWHKASAWEAASSSVPFFWRQRKNDGLCHLRTITHDGKTSIDGWETFPSKGEKELGSP
jgi:hypothetical protein